jgi:hypothetical protein
MSIPAGSARPPRVSWRFVSLLIAATGIALLVAANTHLVYVAFTSQPDCVPHEKAAGNGSFRAARSAC